MRSIRPNCPSTTAEHWPILTATRCTSARWVKTRWGTRESLLIRRHSARFAWAEKCPDPTTWPRSLSHRTTCKPSSCPGDPRRNSSSTSKKTTRSLSKFKLLSIELWHLFKNQPIIAMASNSLFKHLKVSWIRISSWKYLNSKFKVTKIMQIRRVWNGLGGCF